MLMRMDHKDLTLSNSQQSRSDDHSSSSSTDFADFLGGIQVILHHTSWKLAFRSSKEATYVANYRLYTVPPQRQSTNVFERNMVVHKDGFTKGSKCGCPTLPVSLSPTTKLLHILGIAVYLVHVSHAYFSNSF